MKHYYIHNNVKLRKGGRTIAKMSEKQFAEKVKDFILKTCKNNDWLIEKITSTKSDKKIIRCLTNAIRQTYWDDNKKATTKIVKDFKGISPDWENYEMYGDLRTIKGAPYIIMRVGGDWESPIAIFVYHDGKEFRCYIPKKGNPYRDDTKKCLGNIDAKYDSNTKTYTDVYKSEYSKKTLISDDKYVFDSLVKDGIIDKDEDINDYRGIANHVYIDINACIEDFSERVEVKQLKESFTFNQNKALYESIINNIAINVKKIINENI